MSLVQEGARLPSDVSDLRDASPPQTAANLEDRFVDANIEGDAARMSEARLLVHAHSDFAGRMRSFRSVLRRLCGLHLEAPRVPSPMRVQVADLQGRELRCVDTFEPLIDLSLPPGTYGVTVTLGTVCRRYTMTLVPGASCHLHLRLAHVAA